MKKQQILAAAKKISKTLEPGTQRQIDGSLYFLFHDKYKKEIYIGYYLSDSMPNKLYAKEPEQPMTDFRTGLVQGWFQKLL